MERLHPADGGVWGDIFGVAWIPNGGAQGRDILYSAAWLGVEPSCAPPWGDIGAIRGPHGHRWFGPGPIYLVLLQFIGMWRDTLGAKLAVGCHGEMHTVFRTKGLSSEIRSGKGGVCGFLRCVFRLRDGEGQRQAVIHSGKGVVGGHVGHVSSACMQGGSDLTFHGPGRGHRCGEAAGGV